MMLPHQGVLMKLYFIAFVLIASNAFARGNSCDLQVSMRRVSDEPESYFKQVETILRKKGYTNIEFMSSSDTYKRLVLHFGTETRVFQVSEMAYMLLADETKFSTDEKYLYHDEMKSYWIGVPEAYLKLIRHLPNCQY